ncbi:nucleoside-diphosphate kinase [Candidatus Woesearchaeota archaeon]|jgi:nucleoside-diphosphate kinase|nr:nucleoside-diphosphate kinase [Candidatus Woesearchaeota archaeon]MBT5740596.1 nucleoside-diphosphate kinase [Candidatus Woesearchaeota archaeon]
MNPERTLVLIKPDGVKRGLIGRILSRFEDAGLKIVGTKMVQIDEDFGQKHYHDIAERRGEQVLHSLLKFMTSGPVVAMCLEGINAVENVRKMVGGTEPKGALPGTIRGDFAHMSFGHADTQKKAIENLIHASGTVTEAEQEVFLWFNMEELHSYKTVHEVHVF